MHMFCNLIFIFLNNDICEFQIGECQSENDIRNLHDISYLTNTRHPFGAGLVLGQWRRQWVDINPCTDKHDYIVVFNLNY